MYVNLICRSVNFKMYTAISNSDKHRTARVKYFEPLSPNYELVLSQCLFTITSINEEASGILYTNTHNRHENINSYAKYNVYSSEKLYDSKLITDIRMADNYMSMYIDIPPNTRILLSLPGRKLFVTVENMPQDDSRGWLLEPNIIQCVDNSTMDVIQNISIWKPDERIIFVTTRYTYNTNFQMEIELIDFIINEYNIITFAISDNTMPFNVITIVSIYCLLY